MVKTMNHFEYQKSLMKKSNEQLQFIIKDAGEASKIDGVNSGYYADEVLYACAEVAYRSGFLQRPPSLRRAK